MRRSRNFPKKATNFDLLLQDIRTNLAENYVFYRECVFAITRAAARHEDVSAWFEQMQQLIEGVEGLEISQSGVLFLLREIVRAPLVKAMPPMSSHISTTTLPAMEMQPKTNFVKQRMFMLPCEFNLVASQMKGAPLTGLQNPTHDPIFFNDLIFKDDVETMFRIKAVKSNIADCRNITQQKSNDNASYNDPDDFIPRYNPTADDLQIFKNTADAAKPIEPQGESERGQIVAQLQHMRQLLGLLEGP